jgi:hypothetical protein
LYEKPVDEHPRRHFGTPDDARVALERGLA